MSTIHEVVSFAIEQEQEAFNFYTEMAKNARGAGMKQTFLEFADEEKAHKKKLEAVLNGVIQLKVDTQKPILDLKISDYVVDVEPNGEMDYQKSLVLAMKKEKAAFMLYSNLALAVNEPEVKATFLALAQEEAKHKLRFEVEYDEQILKEN